MRELSNTTGSANHSETSVKNRNLEISSWSSAQDVINKANTVPLLHIFKHYKLRLDESNRKIICPMPSHQGGHESTPSFWFYPETNSFFCFGCKAGIKPIDFISTLENISRMDAANKIVDLFENEIDPEDIHDAENYKDRVSILVEFSNVVKNFITQNIENNKQLNKIETLCSVFDKMNTKHKLDNEGLQALVDNLKEKI